MSGLGAPERTAMPMSDFARSTLLPATTRPARMSASSEADATMITSTASPRAIRFGIASAPTPIVVVSVTTFSFASRSNWGESWR